MAERPILMSAPMVRAIMAGTKTQTRRVLRDQPCELLDFNRGGLSIRVRGAVYQAFHPKFPPVRCPYGQPGDRLWVRETWRVCGGREYEYQQDRSEVMYRATHQEDGFPLTWESYAWRPSIHMPRWASRITLELTGVRVERLQDISEADAKAEGIEIDSIDAALLARDYQRGGWYQDWLEDAKDYVPTERLCRASYQSLWEQINGPGSWDANPWVWVVEFRRVSCP